MLAQYLVSMDRILIAGAGVTGALCSSFLTTTINGSETLKPPSLTIWDKGRGAGGRMSTSRAPGGSGAGSGGGGAGTLPTSTADLGAQYFTAMEKDWDSETADYHRDTYDELLRAGERERKKERYR